jgi:hypothetical protein
MKQALSWLALGFFLAGCGGSGKGAESAGADSATSGGGSLDDPISTCGPDDSYEFVANRFQCPSGPNPFRGDPKRAAESRRGSSTSAKTGHPVDVYEVPCAGGSVEVFVDLYGCPEYAERLRAVEKGSPEGEALMADFQAGKFQEVIEHCSGLGEDAKPDEETWCVALVPAALHAQKRDAEALDEIGNYCSHMPPASAQSDARAAHIALVMVSLSEAARNGHFTATEEQQNELAESWLKVCQVPPEQLDRVIDALSQ